MEYYSRYFISKEIAFLKGWCPNSKDYPNLEYLSLSTNVNSFIKTTLKISQRIVYHL